MKNFNKLFGKSLSDIIYLLSVGSKQIELKGSYESSLWASDIDLYQRVSHKDAKTIEDVIKKVAKSDLDIEEIKVVKSDDQKKYFKNFGKIKIDNNIEYLKIDIVLLDQLIYPMDLSIIYDITGAFDITVEELSNKLLDDVSGDNMYKSLKRLNVILEETKYPKFFSPITEDPIYGVRYQATHRLDMLKRIRKDLTKKEYQKYRDVVKTDLSKIGYSGKLDVSSIRRDLNKLITKELRKILRQ